MPTSSFFHNLEIKSPKQVRKLIKILEQSEKAQTGKNEVHPPPVIEIKQDQAKEVFSKIKW